MLAHDLTELLGGTVAPVSLQFGSGGDPGDRLDARLYHTGNRDLLRMLVPSAVRITHRINILTVIDRREAQKCDADFRGPARDKQLVTAGHPHCLDEIRVVPRVNLTRAIDDDRIG